MPRSTILAAGYPGSLGGGPSPAAGAAASPASWERRVGDLHTGRGRLGYYLRATASYIDALGSGRTASAISANVVQAAPIMDVAPVFSAATATRSVAENVAAGALVGAAVRATDADNDVLTYSLSGADACSFSINMATGQITVGAGTTFGYETKTSYTIIVTAMDPSGTSATITVNISIVDVVEAPVTPVEPVAPVTPETEPTPEPAPEVGPEPTPAPRPEPTPRPEA